MPGGDFEFAKAFGHWGKGERVFGHMLPIPLFLRLVRAKTLVPVSYKDQKAWKPKAAVMAPAPRTAALTPAPDVEERVPRRGPGRPRKTETITSEEADK